MVLVFGRCKTCILMFSIPRRTKRTRALPYISDPSSVSLHEEVGEDEPVDSYISSNDDCGVVESLPDVPPPCDERELSRHEAFCGYESLSPGEENGEALKDLTGVLATCFSILLGMLAQMRTPRATDITVASRLLLSLMKMKHGLTFAALGALFSVHRTTSCVFYAVPDLLHAKTEGWLVWFPREVVQETMPPSFKEKYPMCRVIIDCTEVPMEMTPEVSEQENCLSSYKSNFTLNFIVGVAPSRFISYVSEVFGDRASDTYITTNCGLLDLLEEDDLVLADKGFPHICYYLESRKAIRATTKPDLHFADDKTDAGDCAACFFLIGLSCSGFCCSSIPASFIVEVLLVHKVKVELLKILFPPHTNPVGFGARRKSFFPEFVPFWAQALLNGPDSYETAHVLVNRDVFHVCNIFYFTF
ncbi:hypothetical protein MRX96_011090 [Rhipicephalus microplus]